MSQIQNAFMVMPFSSSVSKSVYDNCIKPVFDEFGLTIRRADEIFGTTPIYDDIVREIQSASIIVVDITDNNPNVFYELGIAHTLKRNQTIIITNQSFSTTPFDIAHFRIIKYEDSLQGSTDFKKAFRNTLKIVMDDKGVLHKDEFNLIYNLYSANDKLPELTLLPALDFYESLVKSEDRLSIDYEIGEKKSGSYNVWLSRKYYGAYIDFGYLIEKNGLLSLTQAGKSFVTYLTEKGFEINMVNEQKKSDEYVSWTDRYIKKKEKE